LQKRLELSNLVDDPASHGRPLVATVPWEWAFKPPGYAAERRYAAFPESQLSIKPKLSGRDLKCVSKSFG
jgi:hypothetical protein